MLKGLLLILTSIVIGLNPVSSQLQADWGHAFGSSIGNAAVKTVHKDNSGNVCIVGYFAGTIDIDPGVSIINISSAGGRDIFVAKYSATGTYLWHKQIGAANDDFAMSMDMDASDNICITGSFAGVVDFDPGAGSSTLNSGGAANESIFVLKLDNVGNYQWAVTMAGPNADRGWDIVTDNSGNVYTTGNFNGTVDFDPGAGTSNLVSTTTDVFVSKLSSTGTFVWAKSFNCSGTLDLGYGIDLDATGNVYLGGTFSGTIDLDPGATDVNYTSIGQRDIYICKLDAGGTYVDSWAAGYLFDDECYDIKAGADGVYITGKIAGTADFDPNVTSNGPVFTGGASDFYLVKYDFNLNYVWGLNAYSTGNEIAQAIEVDPAGDILVTGTYSTSADFDPSFAVYSLTATASSPLSFFLAKYSSNGIYKYARTTGETLGGAPQSIETSGTDVYLAGMFNLGVDMDPSSSSYVLTSPSGGAPTNCFLMKYNACVVPVSPDTILGPLNICQNDTILFQINSIIGATSYTWNMLGACGWTSNFIDTTATLVVGTCGLPISVNSNNACGASVPVFIYPAILNVPNTTGPPIGPGTICSSDSADYYVAFGGFATSIVWQFPSGWTSAPVGIGFNTNVFSGTTSGNIIVYGSNICGTSVPETLSVVVTERPVLFANDVTICSGSPAELEASSSFGTIYWHSDTSNVDTLASGPNFTTSPLTNDTSYYISANNMGCSSLSDYLVNVIVTPMPDINTIVGSNSISAQQSGALYQWLDCDNSMMSISGETSQVFPLTANGSYAVHINLNGCVDTSSCVVVDDLSIEGHSPQNMVAYPNPIDHEFALITGVTSIYQVELYDLNGRMIWKSNVQTVYRIGEILPGAYFLKVMYDEGMDTIKLIKK